MSIVLKENEWAAEMIDAKSLGKKPSETLCRIARYYMDNGYDSLGVRNALENFLIQCDSNVSIPKWSASLDYAISLASKREAVDIDGIIITEPEMQTIDSIVGKQLRRLAFVLLCLSKYWAAVIKSNNYWVSNKDNEIMAMANINTSIRRQGLMYNALNELGLIQLPRRVDNTNVRVTFVKEGKPVMYITDFRNLGYQYLKYHGESYIECQNCGVTTKLKDPVKGRHQKYCPACAIEVATQQRVNSVMKRRKKC